MVLSRHPIDTSICPRPIIVSSCFIIIFVSWPLTLSKWLFKNFSLSLQEANYNYFGGIEPDHDWYETSHGDRNRRQITSPQHWNHAKYRQNNTFVKRKCWPNAEKTWATWSADNATEVQIISSSIITLIWRKRDIGFAISKEMKTRT